jgi:PhoH-like ATPase
MARKNFVLDTNVLLHDPRAMFTFADNHVFVPIYVLEEIDSFKKEMSERGRNAREVSRHLDNLRQKGRLSEGVALEKGGLLKVAIGTRALPDPLRTSQIADNFILAVALEVRDAEPSVRTFLVTKDVNLRVRGDALGLLTADYDPEKIDIQELYAGWREVDVDGGEVDSFYQEGSLTLDGNPGPDRPLHPNEYLLLRDRQNGGHTALGRWDRDKKRVVPVRKLREGVWGIRPRNKEQHYALDLLLNDDVKLVTLVGKAGTGKTLVAIAAGLQKVVEESVYHKLLVSRPVYPLGRDIGYLPGDIEEKLNPWMQPIYDNVELLLGISKDGKKEGRSYTEMLDLGYIEIEPLTYIRGRSIPNQYMIVDEAQNLTPHEVKTIITRVGDGTKIILTGDPYQIDNPYVDAANNGLTTVVERFKDEPIAGHVTLTRGERSALAELASNVL